MTNPEIVKAILELFKERGVNGQYFQPNTYEKEEFMPHSKLLGGLPITDVNISYNPITDEPDGGIEIIAYNKRGQMKSLTLDGSEDEDFYNLLDEIYYYANAPEDDELEDWLRARGYKL